MNMNGAVIALSRSKRSALMTLVGDGNTAQKIVKRARIIVLSAEGHGTTAIMRAAGVSKTTAWRWQEYFVKAGVADRERRRCRTAALLSTHCSTLATIRTRHMQRIEQVEDTPAAEQAALGRLNDES